MRTRTGVLDRRVLTSSTDEELVEATRSGSIEAFEELYHRHVEAARRTARYLLRSKHEMDDVVSEAFAGVLSALQNGRGPRDNFRSYLMACVRNGCTTRGRRLRCTPMDPAGFSDRPQLLEDPERFVEADAVATAFASLSPRWQRVLWLTEVEDLPLADVAEDLCLPKGATSAISHRAHQAFAEAYLAQCVAGNGPAGTSATPTECSKVAPKLAHFVRGKSRPVEHRAVEAHLANCDTCRESVDSLQTVNQSLRNLQGPAMAIAAGALLAVNAFTGAAVVGSIGAIGVLGIIGGATLLTKLVATVAFGGQPTLAQTDLYAAEAAHHGIAVSAPGGGGASAAGASPLDGVVDGVVNDGSDAGGPSVEPGGSVLLDWLIPGGPSLDGGKSPAVTIGGNVGVGGAPVSDGSPGAGSGSASGTGADAGTGTAGGSAPEGGPATPGGTAPPTGISITGALPTGSQSGGVAASANVGLLPGVPVDASANASVGANGVSATIGIGAGPVAIGVDAGVGVGAGSAPNVSVVVSVPPVLGVTLPSVNVTAPLPSLLVTLPTLPALPLNVPNIPITIPPVAITLPPVTLPPMPLPPVTIPVISVPGLPVITLPPVKLPPVTIPPLIGGIFGR